jgi:porphobilinogen deaminase
MAKRKIVIGTRGSKLALWQANFVAAEIRSEHPDVLVMIKVIQTTGDRMQNMPLSQIGGKGLFTKEIEEEMLAGEVDLAIHSLKDVPTRLPEGLELAVIMKRAHPGDAFISNSVKTLDELPPGARIGTSSLRRGAQIRHYRPDLEILPMRGNVDSRLAKLDAGMYDGIVLAVSGLQRLGWESRIDQILPYEICLPAAGQGALALEIRSSDERIEEIIGFLEDIPTRYSVEAERSFLGYLEGNCQVPFGVYGEIEAGKLHLEATILTPDGKTCLREKVSGSPEDGKELGRVLAEHLANQGGKTILAELQGKAREVEW